MSDKLLHHGLVRAPGADPQGVLLFLHGILGSGANLRGLAQAFVQAHPHYAAVLVDLRLHGRSRDLPPPHDVRTCAADLVALEPHLLGPVAGVVGHSFGGKVALAYHALRPALRRLLLLDSAPGVSADRVGSEETLAVLAMLGQLPRRYPTREAFVARVQGEGHGRAIADWLAMNLARRPDGFTLEVDVAAIGQLLDSYFATDLWPVLERSTAHVDVVIGGRSRVWSPASRARLDALAATKPGQIGVHLLPEAGHWVHVDDPQGVRAALLDDGGVLDEG